MIHFIQGLLNVESHIFFSAVRQCLHSYVFDETSISIICEILHC
uniref:Uncharacterized protein n=1 Tax=Arundo donax TaxID=35708 RepID=A0A0A9FVG3_ARUDO